MQLDSMLAFAVATVVTLLIVSLTTLSGIVGHTRRVQDKNKHGVYEDEDGKATPDSFAIFSTTWQKVAAVAWATIGLGCHATYSAVSQLLQPPPDENKQSPPVWNWLVTASWAFLTIQAIGIAATQDPVYAFQRGAYLAVSSLAVGGLSLFELTGRSSENADAISMILRIASIMAAACLMATGLLLPRRPDVFFNGHLVDRMRSVSLYKRLTFGWASHLVASAAKKGDLEMKDLPHLIGRMRAATASATWESRPSRCSLFSFILRSYGWHVLRQWTVAITNAAISYLPWWIMLSLLETLESQKPGEPIGNRVWMLLVWLAIAKLANAILESLLLWHSIIDLRIPIRSQLTAIIYEKSLRRKHITAAKRDQSRQRSLDGGGAPPKSDSEDGATDKKSQRAVINLVGLDANRIAHFSLIQYMFPTSALRLFISTWFLIYLLGWVPILLGFLSAAFIMPINYILSKILFATGQRLMKIRDQKLELMNDALQGIRQIKFSALEWQWENRILSLRDKEMATLWEYFRSTIVFEACWTAAPIILAITSLGSYAWIHGTITPSTAFTSLGILSTLDFTVSMMPTILRLGIDCWVSLGRIEKYLDGPELGKTRHDGVEICFDAACLAWPANDDAGTDPARFVLRDVSLTFPLGELSVIVGKTGSGKSMLLAALLGEADLLSGSISFPSPPTLHEHQGDWILPAAVAYVGQIPWIENATLKNNILFGLPFVSERYKQTLTACALNKDLQGLPNGDDTELGVNGVNLSGGQKWRVAVARAVYSRAGILIMDDIFSAIDATVGREILEGCLLGSLCEGRTRILATHHLGLVQKHTKLIVGLAEGSVQYAGPASGLGEEVALERIKRLDVDDSDSQGPQGVEGMESAVKTVEMKAPRKFVEDESRQKGSVKGRIYAIYMNASGGWIIWALFAAWYLSYEGTLIARSWVLKLWTSQEEASSKPSPTTSGSFENAFYHGQQVFTPHDHALNEQEQGVEFWLLLYGGIGFVGIILGVFRVYVTCLASYRASRALFQKILFTVLRAPLGWTDAVPIGRILNRFTSDFEAIDANLAQTGSGFIKTLLQAIGICVASIFVSPLILPFAAVCLVWVAWLGVAYLQVARPMKRLESTAKSPIYEIFGSSLTGLTTIRAFDRVSSYHQAMHTKIDNFAKSSLNLNLFSRWLGWNMSIIGVIFTVIVAIFVLTIRAKADAALAGFVLTFTMQFSSTILWTVRTYAELELEMNAVERVVEYAEMDTESSAGEKPPAAWPTSGRLQVHNLVVGHAPDLPPVLNKLTFDVRPAERIGIVGRTGAGKSTLTLALFRFLEARSGSIYIDGLDVSKIQLPYLRSRMAIIPQDPVLFSGTVRWNLDPFSDHSDEELYDALRRVHLISDEELRAGSTDNINIFHNLDSQISEGGHNLSQGQRQLLCLARAIISRPKLMVLDEATSAVDMATDALIQRSIREEFHGSTLLVIAHRLSTIADFDRILVLADGKIAEFGTPKELWEASGGHSIFGAMCEESGEREMLKSMIRG